MVNRKIPAPLPAAAPLLLAALLPPAAARALGRPDWAIPHLAQPTPSGTYIAPADSWVVVYEEVRFDLSATANLSEHHRAIVPESPYRHGVRTPVRARGADPVILRVGELLDDIGPAQQSRFTRHAQPTPTRQGKEEPPFRVGQLAQDGGGLSRRDIALLVRTWRGPRDTS